MRNLLPTAILLAAAAIAGCASSSETAQSDKLTEHVGNYPPPPPGPRLRTGVPPFLVTDKDEKGHGLERLAADQMTTLATMCRRFDVIERAQLEQLEKEQARAGSVPPDELAQGGKLHGVEFLILGKVTNFRVKAEKTSTGLGIARVPIVGVGGFDMKKKENVISVDCGVDIRLVDASTGSVAAANFGEYKRQDSTSAIGVTVLGGSAQSGADLKIDQDSQGKILRLALDDALRKMLPEIDDQIAARKTAAPAHGAAAVAPSAPTAAGSPGATTGGKFCSGCGVKNVAGAKFCSGCGGKME